MPKVTGESTDRLVDSVSTETYTTGTCFWRQEHNGKT
jgi:hypothetical protein